MTRKTAALSAVGAALAVATLLSACSGASSANAQFDPKITTTVPAAHSAVASITWNLPYGEPTSLDPALSALESNSTVVANLCESLYTQTTDGKTKPGLASSVDVSSDDRTLKIHLRNGVKFWDGQPLTAGDVVYSIDRVLNPSVGSSWPMWALGPVTVTATAADEVTVTMQKASALIQNFLATPAFAVVEKAYTEKAGSKFGTAQGGVMCTGPYKLDTWSTGSNITVERNPNWWNTGVKPQVERAKFVFTTDSSAQIAALRSGSIDGSYSVPVSGFKSLGAQGNLLFNYSYNTQYLAISNFKGSLADVKTRAALQQVVDYAGIAKSIYLGTADTLRAVTPKATWGYAKPTFQKAWDALPAAKQDLAKAKSLLKESSYSGAPVVLAYPAANEEQAKMATVIADSASQVGLKVTLKPLQPADYYALFGGPDARKGIDTFISIGYLDFPDPAEYYQYWTTGNYYNFGDYSNPQFDALMYKALSEVDDTARADDVVQAQALLAKDVAVVPIISDHVSVYYSKKLAGLVPSMSYLYAPWLATLGGK